MTSRSTAAPPAAAAKMGVKDDEDPSSVDTAAWPCCSVGASGDAVGVVAGNEAGGGLGSGGPGEGGGG